MKTLEEILNYKGGENCNFLDGRDRSRLCCFFPPSDWPKLGFEVKKDANLNELEVIPYTKENVIKKLETDLAFAFDKALGQRGISSSLMFDVIKMWMWVLDDELANFPDYDYAQYGLPLYKKVAVKYNLNNPIGDDYGNEEKYASESY